MWMAGDYPYDTVEHKELDKIRWEIDVIGLSSSAAFTAAGISFWIKDTDVFGRSGTEVPPAWFKPLNGDSR